MPVRPFNALGVACFLGGLGLLLVSCYVHIATIADIPAAEMTLRLQATGWEWACGGILLIALSTIFRGK